MISSLGFTGKIYQLGNVRENSKPDEIQQIQKYSDDKGIDIILNSSNKGVYDAILIKENKAKGQNEFAQQTFDFNNNPTLEDKEKPEYKSCLSALWA